jgi:hypothetical protein
MNITRHVAVLLLIDRRKRLSDKLISSLDVLGMCGIIRTPGLIWRAQARRNGP